MAKGYGINPAKDEVIDLLREGQDKIKEGIELLEQAYRLAPEPFYECYVLNNLKAHTSEDYGFLEQNTIDAWIREIGGGDEN